MTARGPRAAPQPGAARLTATLQGGAGDGSAGRVGLVADVDDPQQGESPALAAALLALRLADHGLGVRVLGTPAAWDRAALAGLADLDVLVAAPGIDWSVLPDAVVRIAVAAPDAAPDPDAAADPGADATLHGSLDDPGDDLADRLAAAVADLLGRRATGSPAPRSAARTLHTYPDFARNPFQQLLYAGLPQRGYQRVRVEDLLTHLRRRTWAPGPAGVLNVQWTDPVLRGVGGPFAARLLLDDLDRALQAYAAAGGRLVWTVHNVLPHDGGHPWAEIELCRLLARSADVVHVLSEETLAAAEPWFHLDPARTVVIDHASYLGHYPDTVDRTQARRRLGIGADERALIAVGGVRPYKGLDRLVEVFDVLHAEDPRLRLLIAGRPGQRARSAAFEAACQADPRIVCRFDFVPDDELQVWMRAADVAVLAYRNILNSGAFLLAQTFGLPTVAPHDGALARFASEPQVRSFAPDDDASLEAAVRSALALVEDPAALHGAQEAALRLARERSPERMAAAFADLVVGVDASPDPQHEHQHEHDQRSTT